MAQPSSPAPLCMLPSRHVACGHFLYCTNSKNAAVLCQRAATWGDSQSLGFASSTQKKITCEKRLKAKNGQALGHAAIGFQWKHNEKEIANPFVPPVPLHTPPPYFVHKAYALTPPAIHMNSLACVPVDRRDQHSLQGAPVNTCQCFTSVECDRHASLHNSHLQNQSDASDREDRLHFPYLRVCIHSRLQHAHLRKGLRRVLKREGPLSQVGLKDKKNAISISVCHCAGAGRGYLRWHWCRCHRF